MKFLIVIAAFSLFSIYAEGAKKPIELYLKCENTALSSKLYTNINRSSGMCEASSSESVPVWIRISNNSYNIQYRSALTRINYKEAKNGKCDWEYPSLEYFAEKASKTGTGAYHEYEDRPLKFAEYFTILSSLGPENCFFHACNTAIKATDREYIIETKTKTKPKGRWGTLSRQTLNRLTGEWKISGNSYISYICEPIKKDEYTDWYIESELLLGDIKRKEKKFLDKNKKF